MDRSDHDSDDMLKPAAEAGSSQAEQKPDHRAERANRLAAALRQNLKRQKLPKTNLRPVDERN